MKILRHGWNVHNGKNKNLRNKSNKEKNLLPFSNVPWASTHILMTLCHVICMEFVKGHFYHCVSHSDAGETCVAGLSSLSASTWFHPIWRLPMTQVGEIPSSYSYLIRLVFYTVALFIYKYSVQCVRCTLLQAHLCFVIWNIRLLPNHYFVVRNHNYQKVGISRIKNKHV